MERDIDIFTQKYILDFFEKQKILQIITNCDLFKSYRENIKKLDVPRWFKDDDLILFPNLIDIDCKHNPHLTSNSICKFTHLERLNCDKCPNIKNLNTLVNLKSLTCPLTQICDDDIIDLVNLTYLECWCSSTITDKSISRFTNLQILECAMCTNITDNGISHLHELVELNCRDNNKITGECFKNLSSLMTLNCGNCPLITDQAISVLKNLVDLVCDSCQISHGISELYELRSLTCDRCPVTDKYISGLKHLKRLACRHTNISSSCIASFKNLKEIFCSECVNISVEAKKYFEHTLHIQMYN